MTSTVFIVLSILFIFMLLVFFFSRDDEIPNSQPLPPVNRKARHNNIKHHENASQVDTQTSIKHNTPHDYQHSTAPLSKDNLPNSVLSQPKNITSSATSAIPVDFQSNNSELNYANQHLRKKGLMEKLFEDVLEQPQLSSFDDLRKMHFGWFQKGIIHFLICCVLYFFILIYRVIYMLVQFIVFIVVEIIGELIILNMIHIIWWIIKLPFIVIIYLFGQS